MTSHHAFRLPGIQLLLLGAAFAQQDRATFTGTITDPTGSVVPKVKAAVQNIDTNGTYRASTTTYIGGDFVESNVSLESVEEFKVQTSGLSAEFGRTGGGVFNFVLKSGTNQPHGSAVFLYKNAFLDANSFSNNFFGRPKNQD